MAREWSFYRDFLPILVLLADECNDMGVLTLFKVASLQGMNSYVFVAYAYAVATTVLLPITFFHRRYMQNHHKGLNFLCLKDFISYHVLFLCLFADQECFLHSVSPLYPK